MSTRIALIGGYLGAGKTTLITKLAKELKEKGSSVAIITNDQGEVLVDTQFSRSLDLKVAEVLRGCFCCRFQDFLISARSLISIEKPDYILAEPVGSCTDLLATVVAPLRLMYPNEFELSPLIVLVDGTWLLGTRLDEDDVNSYLRRKQIEEAEIVVVSKADHVPKDAKDEVEGKIREINKDASIIAYSSITGAGLSQIMEVITSKRTSARSGIEIDYDTYAQAEAELGWYNGKFNFTASEKMDAYDLTMKIMREISAIYGGDEIAHVKLFLKSESNAMKVNLVGRTLTVDGVRGSRYGIGKIELIMNARIVSSPEKLKETIRNAVERSGRSLNMETENIEDASFSPSRPQPTHRISAV